MDALDLFKRGEKAFTRKADLDSLNQELAEHFYPERATFTTQSDWGEEYASHLFESSPVLFRRDLGNAFSSMLRPRNLMWFGLATEDRAMMKRGPVNSWCQIVTQQLWSLLYSRGSRFVTAAKAGDHDFATFGNAVLSAEFNADQSGFLYRNWHLKDVAWCEDMDGEIDIVWRKMLLPARQIVGRWGKSENLHQDIKRAAEKEPDKEFPVMHIMCRAEDYEGSVRSGDRFPYVSIYIDVTNRKALSEEGSHEFRYIIPRWARITGSPYGTSPATMTALPDARMIQSLSRVLIDAAEKTVDPPMKATEESIRGEINFFSGGITWVDREYDEKLGPALEPIFLGKNVGVGVDIQDRTRIMLADAMYISKLSMPQQHEKTAFETAQLVQEYIREAIPIFEPLESEYNVPLLEEPFRALMRLGALPPPPEELRGSSVEFSFTNPLQDAIEKSKVYQFQSAMEVTSMGASLDNSAVTVLNIPTALRDAIRGGGAPEEWLASEEEVAAAAEQMKAMEMAAGMAQIAQPVADAASKVSDAEQKANASGRE